MAEPGGADRECRSEQHRIVVLVRQAADPLRDVHVRGAEQPDRVELAQQPGGAARDSGVERVAARGSERAHGSPPWSSTSLSAEMSAPGGRQANTPVGDPSSTGVCAPAIPRTNRYSTPARWRPGS